MASVEVPETEKFWVMVVVPARSSPVPVAFVKLRFVIVAVETEAFHQRVLSADKSPPPKRLEPAVMERVDETAEIPSEKAPVWLLKKIGAVADKEVVVILALNL